MWIGPNCCCVQTRSRLPGTVWRSLIFFTPDRPHYPWMPPLFALRGQSQLRWFWLCIRSCTHFDENSCAISIMSPRSLSPQHFVPRPNTFWWDHREKSQQASTLSYLADFPQYLGPSLNAGYLSSGIRDSKGTVETRVGILFMYGSLEHGHLLCECYTLNIKINLSLP